MWIHHGNNLRSIMKIWIRSVSVSGPKWKCCPAAANWKVQVTQASSMNWCNLRQWLSFHVCWSIVLRWVSTISFDSLWLHSNFRVKLEQVNSRFHFVSTHRLFIKRFLMVLIGVNTFRVLNFARSSEWRLTNVLQSRLKDKINWKSEKLKVFHFTLCLLINIRHGKRVLLMFTIKRRFNASLAIHKASITVMIFKSNEIETMELWNIFNCVIECQIFSLDLTLITELNKSLMKTFPSIVKTK